MDAQRQSPHSPRALLERVRQALTSPASSSELVSALRLIPRELLAREAPLVVLLGHRGKLLGRFRELLMVHWLRGVLASENRMRRLDRAPERGISRRLERLRQRADRIASARLPLFHPLYARRKSPFSVVGDRIDRLRNCQCGHGLPRLLIPTA